MPGIARIVLTAWRKAPRGGCMVQILTVNLVYVCLAAYLLLLDWARYSERIFCLARAAIIVYDFL